MIDKTSKTALFGTFDIIHPGHLHFFQQARESACPDSRLVVVVARDSNVEKEKGKAPKHDEQERLAKVKELDIVDEAVLGSEKIDFSIIDEIRPDIIALGYDQKTPPGFEEYIKDKDIEVIRLKPHRPEEFKSSKLSH
ncbi:adenylyltransferase/cytidyltransferase family protein [Candidatus Woesearchaeota archaeon]|nr:adenylyltransferase/cytidyltransferase family protein [Candidatus Woesearchaeota archaeon]